MKTYISTAIAALLLGCAALPTNDPNDIYYKKLPENISRALGSPEVIQRLDATRAKGFPVSLKELDAWFAQVPAAENAAEILWPILSSLNTNKTALKLSEAERELLKKALAPESKYKPLPAEMTVPISDFLKRHSSHMTALREGSLRKHCRFPINLSQGAATLLPHLSNYRTACNLFEIEGLQHAANGDLKTAVQNFETVVRLTQTLRDEPTLISVLVQYACHGVITGYAERLLALHTFDDAQLARMQTAVALLHNPAAMRRAFTSERCMALDFFTIKPEAWMRFADMGTTNSNPKQALAKARQIVGRSDTAIRSELLFLFDFYDQCDSAGSRPYTEQIKSMEPTFAALRSNDAESRYPICIVMFPALNQILARAAKNSAQLHCAETGIAIARYRLANEGRLPKQLAELTPRFLSNQLQDPFDGQPLKYRVENGTIARVHSIGANLKEDGGGGLTSSDPTKDDIVFVIGRKD